MTLNTYTKYTLLVYILYLEAASRTIVAICGINNFGPSSESFVHVYVCVMLRKKNTLHGWFLICTRTATCSMHVLAQNSNYIVAFIAIFLHLIFLFFVPFYKFIHSLRYIFKPWSIGIVPKCNQFEKISTTLSVNYCNLLQPDSVVFFCWIYFRVFLFLLFNVFCLVFLRSGKFTIM